MAVDPSDCAAQYSIRAVARATGLSIESLRAWERRYGVVKPKRGSGGHRVYTSADVLRLIRLRGATVCGHSIGKVVHLSNDELTRLAPDGAGDDEEVPRGVAQTLVSRILDSVARYVPAECEQAVAMAFALLPLNEVVHEVLSPALREVGVRWRRGEFAIGQERMVSSAVRHRIMSLLNTYHPLAKGPTVVFATLSGERHELGILMYAALAASRSLRVCYLGVDLPADDIVDYAHRVDAAAVAVSMVIADDLRRSLRQLTALRKRLRSPVELWIGGAATCGVAPPRMPPGTVVMAGGADFEERVDFLSASVR